MEGKGAEEEASISEREFQDVYMVQSKTALSETGMVAKPRGTGEKKRWANMLHLPDMSVQLRFCKENTEQVG